jgi:hypothetical protein
LHKRKNALFAGSDGGGEHWAVIASLIETCKLVGIDPLAYVTDIVIKLVNGHLNSRTSAVSLASAPRPYVRLLALNTGRWPRRISEDRLIPDHVIPIEILDPLPVAEGDHRDFATIAKTARSVAMSYSRRDVEGRLLGRYR